MHKKPPVPVIVIIVLLLIIAGYYGIVALTANGNDPLQVSGTIEAAEVIVSPEMPGKVVEVYVDEGEIVAKGDLLFKLDDTLLQAQWSVAETSLETALSSVSAAHAARETAQANYDLALIAARTEAALNRTSDWTTSNLPGYDLPGGYFFSQELLDAAAGEVEAARTARDEVRNSLQSKLGDTASKDFVNVEKDLLAARFAEVSALDALNRARRSLDQDLVDAAQDVYDQKQDETESAQSAYDRLADTQAALEIISLRLEYSIAQERYESAQDRLLQLQIGEASPKLKAALAALDQAELAISHAGSLQSQAEAQLNLLDVQISKLSIHSPTSGTILTRKIHPGEVVAAGASALVLGELDELSIVVYVPEDVYGTLALGQMADLSVDSFPGEKFSAEVTRIADQAEFTPRNVQTVEGRKSTVFAVHLRVVDPGGKLKPGMAADLVFE
ncbi:HlyD family secretion protein [Chloroflexota bacterium]